MRHSPLTMSIDYPLGTDNVIVKLTGPAGSGKTFWLHREAVKGDSEVFTYSEVQTPRIFRLLSKLPVVLVDEVPKDKVDELHQQLVKLGKSAWYAVSS